MKKLMFVAVFCLAGLLAACGDKGGAGGDPILGTWVVDIEHFTEAVKAQLGITGDVPAGSNPLLDGIVGGMSKVTVTFSANGSFTGVGPKEGGRGMPTMETKTGTWKKTDAGYLAIVEGDEQDLQLKLDGGHLLLEPVEKGKTSKMDDAIRMKRK